ncbi:class I mannose-6-phosphate isomerase [Turneriella parva]|uniref:Mannose-6-phosphate isomerase, type 1 n=1 Tax=Turneriella parva (strain ATCC BAA-1111 / DSM 21527 / NCTC 11395 / H) TaxID=869212 RepID=I4BAJ6_TURPD|nr:class I mannose-6-phosphate isomerase [Turneriella parva]AFM14303.1 mannose-6-phosphate isomerase, type 1 [Turneriella parva DSM 21527]
MPKPWGGGHLDQIAGHTGEGHIGEYVLFSDMRQFPVMAENSRGRRLVADVWRDLFPGSAGVPFMLKVLSTAEPISLQNHPSDQDLQKLGLTGNGKFECWTILDAGADARMYLGLKQGEDISVLRTLDADAQPMRHFNEYVPQRGEIVELFPGLVHSTVGRLLFYEIQQTSDYTFRIYDFGRGRDLHLDAAIECLHEQTPAISKVPEALETSAFKLRYHPAENLSGIKPVNDTFSVFTWFGCAAEFICDGQSFSLAWGDSVLVFGGIQCSVEKKEGTADHGLPLIDMLFEAYA